LGFYGFGTRIDAANGSNNANRRHTKYSDGDHGLDGRKSSLVSKKHLPSFY
jgi:hypothetical protein